MPGCTEKCWTRVECARCGRSKKPHGRSVPMEAANGYCDQDCSGYDEEPKAGHLWDKHDSTRAYIDPGGWAAHTMECKMCHILTDTTEED